MLVKILKYSFHSPNWLLIFGSYQLRLTRERKEFADPPILIPHNNWFHPHSLSPHPTTSCLLIFSSSFFTFPLAIAFKALQKRPITPKASCLLFAPVIQGVGLSLPCPDSIYYMYCLAGSTTCPWAVQLASLSCCLLSGRPCLFDCVQINMTSLSQCCP